MKREQMVNLNLPTTDIADNYKRIKSLAAQHDMVLDWDRIKRQDNEELERIIQMIERIVEGISAGTATITFSYANGSLA